MLYKLLASDKPLSRATCRMGWGKNISRFQYSSSAKTLLACSDSTTRLPLAAAEHTYCPERSDKD